MNILNAMNNKELLLYLHTVGKYTPTELLLMQRLTEALGALQQLEDEMALESRMK